MNITIPSPPSWIDSQSFFTDTRVKYWPNPGDEEQLANLVRKLRKGDLVRYDGHISKIYSDKPNCDDTSCTYEIIHAYGGDDTQMYKYPNNPQVPLDLRGKKVFGRKVIKTWQNISKPTGFGRIKLWD